MKYKLHTRVRLVHFLYVTIKVYTIFKAKIELLSFAIEYGRGMITGVKFKVNLTKWGRGSCFCWLFYLKFFGAILMESSSQSYTLSHRSKENYRQGGGTVYSHRYVDDLLKMCLPNSTNMLSIRNSNILIT